MNANPTSPHRRKLFRRVLIAVNLVVTGPLLLLLAAEFYVRSEQQTIEARNALIEASLRRQREINEVTSKSLWDAAKRRYRPNMRLDVTIDGERLVATTNSRGYRGPEVEVPKPDGVVRIVCLGASTTVEGPTDETTYPALLQKKLCEHFHGEHIEVVNAGVSANFARDELARLPEILELQPDVIVEYNAVNDLCWRVLPRIYAAAPTWQRKIRNLRLVARKWESLIAPPRGLIERYWKKTVFGDVQKIMNSCAEHHVELVCCSFCYPDPKQLTAEQREYFDYNLRSTWGCPWTSFDEYCRAINVYNELLRKTCASDEAAYLPLNETMNGKPDYYTDICHMTPSGIEAKADVVNSCLTELLEQRIGGDADKDATATDGR